MKVIKHWWIYPLAAILLIFGTVGAAQATGKWISSGKQVFTAGQRFGPEALRGWMTIQQAADGLGMTADELIAIMDPPAGVTLTPDLAFKDVEVIWPEFELSALRTTLGAPAEGAEGPKSSTTPAASASTSAAPSPSRTGTPGGQGTPGGAGTPGAGGGTPTGTGTPRGDRAGGGASAENITGQSTLQGVADDIGVPVATLIAEIGLPADTDPRATLKTLRDTIPGFEIQQVRDAAARLSGG